MQQRFLCAYIGSLRDEPGRQTDGQLCRQLQVRQIKANWLPIVRESAREYGQLVLSGGQLLLQARQCGANRSQV